MTGRNFIVKNAKIFLNVMQKISPENSLRLPKNHKKTKRSHSVMTSMTKIAQSQNPSNFVRL